MPCEILRETRCRGCGRSAPTQDADNLKSTGEAGLQYFLTLVFSSPAFDKKHTVEQIHSFARIAPLIPMWPVSELARDANLRGRARTTSHRPCSSEHGLLGRNKSQRRFAKIQEDTELMSALLRDRSW